MYTKFSKNRKRINYYSEKFLQDIQTVFSYKKYFNVLSITANIPAARSLGQKCLLHEIKVFTLV